MAILNRESWRADKVPISLGRELPVPLDLGILSEGAVGWGREREYGIAFAIIVGGVLGRLALDQVVPDQLPFITFFPTVALVALAPNYTLYAPGLHPRRSLLD